MKFEGRGDGTALEIYNASAGSGKTYTLVKAYLRIALAFPEEWSAILVITFTRKAAAELKDRIVAKLVELVERTDPDACDRYLQTLSDEWARVGVSVRTDQLAANAPAVLRRLLFNYDRFQVSTIDGFVQRVVRSFAHEAGLKAGLSVELDVERAGGEAVALLLEGLRDDDPD
ncbi:MAG: UvrD-helicase domain-containing protein, partial [Bacteroidia bacterium]|nr:UvrD-helicase domain-containing protein [Bacteroidia bacterium]